MSTPLSIAAVTAVLRAIVHRAIGGSWTAETERTRIVTLPPDHVAVSDETGPAVNVFLCAVQPAPEHRAVPARGGQRTDPSLALNLMYVVSAHGVLTLDADILLGQTIAAIHAAPVITPELIRSVLDSAVDDPTGLMPKGFRQEAVKLADDVDQLTMTIRATTIDEWSTIWRAFRTPVRPSVIVEVSNVPIALTSEAGS